MGDLDEDRDAAALADVDQRKLFKEQLQKGAPGRTMAPEDRAQLAAMGVLKGEPEVPGKGAKPTAPGLADGQNIAAAAAKKFTANLDIMQKFDTTVIVKNDKSAAEMAAIAVKVVQADRAAYMDEFRREMDQRIEQLNAATSRPANRANAARTKM